MVQHTDLDKVWYVVSPQNPQKEKKSLLNQHHRMQIIQREISLANDYEEKEIIRLEKLLKKKGNIKDLNKLLCERISNKEINRDNNDLKDHLIRTTMAKLSIDQPNYSGYLKAIKDGYSKD